MSPALDWMTYCRAWARGRVGLLGQDVLPELEGTVDEVNVSEAARVEEGQQGAVELALGEGVKEGPDDVAKQAIPPFVGSRLRRCALPVRALADSHAVSPPCRDA